MPSFRWQGQEWELPTTQNESLLKIRPSIFISYFFAIESNKREPASSSNKHFLTEAYKTMLERKLNLKPADDEMQKALQRWKEDKYWTVGHGGPGDPFSTRANPSSLVTPNSQLSLKGTAMTQNDVVDTTPEKQLECFFWRRDGFCRFSEEECLYAHHPTGKVKEYNDLRDREREKENNSFKPYRHTSNPMPKKTECFFWGQGICKFSDEDCMYAHYRIHDGPDHDWGRREGRYDSPEQTHHNDHNALLTKQLECFFWRRDGHCKFSEEECLYAHHPTGKVKEIPGHPKIGDRDPLLAERIQPAESIRVSNSSHSEKGPQEYTMPKSPSMQLSELTLSAFFDLFCYTNPVARKERPWEIVLTMYKTYVLRNFGKDAAKHVLAAYARTRLPIPSDLLKKHTLQLDDELAKKGVVSSVAYSDKISEEMSNGASKRVRSADDVGALATPKRMKAERDVAATPTTQEAVTVLIQEVRNQNSQKVQEQTEEYPNQRSTRLYSPSMPYMAASQPSFTEPRAYSDIAKNGSTTHKDLSSLSAGRSGTLSTEAPGPASALMKPQRDLLLAPETPTYLGPPLPKGRITNKLNGEPSTAPQTNGTPPSISRLPPVKHSVPGLSHSLSHSLPPSQGPVTNPLPNSSSGVEEAHGKFRQGGILSPTHSHLGTNSPSVTTMMHGHNPILQEKSTNALVRSNGHDAVGPKSSGQHTSVNMMGSIGSNVLASGNAENAFAPNTTGESLHNHQEGAIPEYTMTKNLMTHLAAPIQSPPALGTYIYQERAQEPLGAHIVRLEALLRGALVELETLKRAVG